MTPFAPTSPPAGIAYFRNTCATSLRLRHRDCVFQKYLRYLAPASPPRLRISEILALPRSGFATEIAYFRNTCATSLQLRHRDCVFQKYLALLAPASPPDVRQGYALPEAKNNFLGLCPWFGLSPLYTRFKSRYFFPYSSTNLTFMEHPHDSISYLTRLSRSLHHYCHQRSAPGFSH